MDFEKTKGFWEENINQTHKKLKKIGYNKIIFDKFKDDDSYVKAHAGLPGVYWVFAKDSERIWIELELRSRVSGGERYSQNTLYNCIQKRYSNSKNKIDNITWDEEDRQLYRRKSGSKPIRIKIYLHDRIGVSLIQECSKAMVEFIKVFKPILNACLNQKPFQKI